MKVQTLLFLFTALLFSVCCFGQAPQSISYQTIVRDGNDDIAVSQAVSLQILIRQSAANGTVVYSETHTVSTNQFGLVNLEMGKGTPVIGAFNSIDWANGPYFNEVQLDISGGANYTSMGVQEIVSVPYALYANEAGEDGDWTINGANIVRQNGNVGIGTVNPVYALDLVGGLNTQIDEYLLMVNSSLLGQESLEGAVMGALYGNDLYFVGVATDSAESDPDTSAILGYFNFATGQESQFKAEPSSARINVEDVSGRYDGQIEIRPKDIVLSNQDTLGSRPRQELQIEMDYGLHFRRNQTFLSIDTLGNTYLKGNVGIGVFNPGQPLQMSSGAHVTAGGVWTNASSRALKENISEISTDQALEALKALSPVTYNYLSEQNESYAGFIAEDVPEIVASNDRKSLSPMDIIAVLTKVVQDQQKKIDQLLERIEGEKE